MKIEVRKREITGKKVKQLRKQNMIPGSIFGQNMDSINIEVGKREFIQLYKQVGHNKMFDLSIEGEGKSFKALVKDIQEDTLKDEIVSFGLYKINENNKIKVEVPIKFVGESKAVKNGLGFLVTLAEEVSIYCFPKDIPSEITIDISKLEEVNASISFSDLKLAENVELDPTLEGSSVIVRIAPPQKEVEVAPVVEEVAEGTTPAADTTKEEEKK